MYLYSLRLKIGHILGLGSIFNTKDQKNLFYNSGINFDEFIYSINFFYYYFLFTKEREDNTCTLKSDFLILFLKF